VFLAERGFTFTWPAFEWIDLGELAITLGIDSAKMDTVREKAKDAVAPRMMGTDIPADMAGLRDILPGQLLVRHGEITLLEGGEGSGKSTVALGALASVFCKSDSLADAPTVLVLTCKPAGEMSCSCPSSLSKYLCNRGYACSIGVIESTLCYTRSECPPPSPSPPCFISNVHTHFFPCPMYRLHVYYRLSIMEVRASLF
jgi:hypothetical protein